ncbi:transcription regulator hth gntr [Lucifera butyrica]|uniref:Transcription regulator hth gntr n=1 Tax=Lucifera butyrica TaxID=1351585 RepID=A0A498REM9_9FIRM|nr:GntR family transcriptional regulator [Lucifera butyrica]VBB09779.1 transcription regulator hth gntr [Lucifera butyrica]
MAILSMTKSASIYNEIKKKIMDGVLEPDTHLVIKQIANEYGVSDIPVREALKELSAEGLVKTIPHIGSKVTGISLKNIKDMLQMREYLEPFAAQLAAKNATEQTITELETCCNSLNEAHQKNDIEHYSKLNKEFHIVIINSCGNQILINTIFDLIESEKRMRKVFEIFPEVMLDSNKEHHKMVEYIKTGNDKALAELMYFHKKRSFDKMRKYFSIDS